MGGQQGQARQQRGQQPHSGVYVAGVRVGRVGGGVDYCRAKKDGASDVINVEGGLEGPRKERMSDQASNGNDGTTEDGRVQRRARYQSINTEPTGTDDVRRDRWRAGLGCTEVATPPSS